MKTETPKKRNMEILKMEAGDTFTGKFVGEFEKSWTDHATGEIKPIKTLIFQDEFDTRVGIFADAGLKNAFESSLVKEGERITIKKLEKRELSGGRTVNQYDIFTA